MAVLYTELCRRLGIDPPIIQAPIGSASGPALASAVSNAGGLGMLSVTWREPAELRMLLRETHAQTRQPFGVNLVLHWPADERLDICLAEGVAVVSFFWGDPTPYVPRVHAAGALVMHTVGSAAEARRCVDAGVDIIIAQGWEAGGHVWGEVATLPLVPCVVDAVAPVPVVAAGGIADGRGLAAVLALGAAGAWLGTRFLASAEAVAHPGYKALVAQAAEGEAVYTRLFDGGWAAAPQRTLRTATVRAWEAAGRPARGQRPGEGEIVGTDGAGQPVYRYDDRLPGPEFDGDIEALALYAGQSAGLINEIQPAGVIVRQLSDEAEAALRRLAALARPTGP